MNHLHCTTTTAGWEKNVDKGDRDWISRAIFITKGRLKDSLSNWHHPPQIKRTYSTKPTADSYFHKSLFLWMPRKMWSVNFHCPNCPDNQSLRSKGLYNRIRLVLDIKSYYYLAAEYMDCAKCKSTFIAYDQRMLCQLSEGPRSLFPIVLTHKYACDSSIISLMRTRTLGNSPSSFQQEIMEVHSEKFLKKVLVYLSDCNGHMKGSDNFNLSATSYEETPLFKCTPKPKWFLATHVRDVWSRLPEIKAAITSTFGSILKIDATKKICKKLHGSAANTAAWSINVGNENGEILQSILATSESSSSLIELAEGLMDRYKMACQQPPILLYTDRDCCNIYGPSKYNALFYEWHDLNVRLDIWHFMRRFARGCTTEAHPLYGPFMSRLSNCIFEWDEEDLSLLLSAKRSEMMKSGIDSPSESAIRKEVTREELARHCKRQTRGYDKTYQAIEELLLSLTGATDSLGVPLLKSEIKEIWKVEQHHIACIQDVPEIQLYSQTGTLKKGDKVLPVYRCGRGSTSLESFHLHLPRFIPGTSANLANFQAYLLDGIFRWNSERASAVQNIKNTRFRTFDIKLLNSVNKLSKKIHNRRYVTESVKLGKLREERLGVEYLLQQSNLVLPDTDQDLNQEIDEGFEDCEISEILDPIPNTFWMKTFKLLALSCF